MKNNYKIDSKISSITQYKIKFKNGFYIIGKHDQSCCENVYADFSSLKDQHLIGKNVESLGFESNCKGGFRLNLDGVGYYVPCYDIQNGYYNNDLDIILYDFMNIKVMEVSVRSLIEEYS